jgi:drug/metabolite transporter (DMT)-like permease
MGDALALLGGLAGAGYILLGRRARGELSLIPYVTLAYGAAALVLTLSAWISGAAMTGYSLRAYLWLLLLALLPQLFAHSTYNWALRYLPAALVSLALLGEPVASALWAALILGERPGLTVIIGGLLVISGITLGSSGSVAADSMSNETARPASTGGR